jgi:hypothetical protein
MAPPIHALDSVQYKYRIDFNEHLHLPGPLFPFLPQNQLRLVKKIPAKKRKKKKRKGSCSWNGVGGR